jgi:hypothetical protein
MSKRFTLAEAQRLIDKVGPLLRKAIELKSNHDEAEQALQELSRRILVNGGTLVDRGEALAVRNRRDAAASHVRETIEEVQEYGCVVKDLKIGLLDFPTVFRGREVYLCWKLGEPSIDWWHGTDEGFAGRKPIDSDFREHHRGERTQ